MFLCFAGFVVSDALRDHIAFIFKVYSIQEEWSMWEAGQETWVWWSMCWRLGKIVVPTGRSEGTHYPQLSLSIFGILTVLYPSAAWVDNGWCPASTPHTYNYTLLQGAHIHPGRSLTFSSWLTNLLWPSPTGIPYMSPMLSRSSWTSFELLRWRICGPPSHVEPPIQWRIPEDLNCPNITVRTSNVIPYLMFHFSCCSDPTLVNCIFKSFSRPRSQASLGDV